MEEIIKETGGEMIPDEAYERWVLYGAPDFIRHAHGCRMMRIGGSYGGTGFIWDSPDSCLKLRRTPGDFIEQNTPPLLDSFHSHYLPFFDLGHAACMEVDFPHEKTDEICGALVQGVPMLLAAGIEQQIISIFNNILMVQTGPGFSNMHAMGAKIKKAMDPHNVANPTRWIDLEVLEAMEKAEE